MLGLSDSWTASSVAMGRAGSLPCRSISNGPGDGMQLTRTLIMGKYFLGWILGVPVIVLVIIYMLFN